MRKLIVLSLLIAGIALAQTAPVPAPADKSTQAPAAQTTAPQEAAKAEEITPETPVITLNGLCPEKPAGTDPKSPDCKTVVTKAQFERLTSTLAPNMPGSAKQQLAGDYARMLVLSEEAKKRGLDKSQKFQDIMNFMRLRVMSQELLSSLQEQAKPTPDQVEKFYQDNKSKYEELALKRVFIPKNRPEPTDKKGAAAPKPPTDEQLQAEGEKVLARLKAGESFDKVQKDVYEAAGFKTPPPPTSIPNWRREIVPAAQQSLFDLKKGDFSNVVIEPAGAYVYQVEDKKTTPLDQVKPEIEQQLATENMKKQMEALTSSIKPDVNEAYFRSIAGEREPVRALTPSGGPAAATPAPKRATPPRSSAAPAAAKPTTTATPKK